MAPRALPPPAARNRMMMREYGGIGKVVRLLDKCTSPNTFQEAARCIFACTKSGPPECDQPCFSSFAREGRHDKSRDEIVVRGHYHSHSRRTCTLRGCPVKGRVGGEVEGTSTSRGTLLLRP